MTRAKLPAAVRRTVLAATYCVYCGDLAPDQVDHVQPVAHGGTDDLENLAAACQFCNYEKLSLTVEEWQQCRAEIGLAWPPPSRWWVLSQICEHLNSTERAALLASLRSDSPGIHAHLTDVVRRARRNAWDGPEYEARRVAALAAA